MTLREKQSAFARAIASLILWITEEGKRRGEKWEVTLADGAVDPYRKVITASGQLVVGHDRQHMDGSLHYLRLAQDLNLFVDGQLVKDGSHPEWKAIGEHWEAMHPELRWGGRFTSVDANHFSFEHEGRS